MTKLPNGLYALPEGIDVSSVCAPNTHLTPQGQREHAFVLLNQHMATMLPDSESSALAALEAALGNTPTSSPVSQADHECRAVIARRKAREAAYAAIENGYRP